MLSRVASQLKTVYDYKNADIIGLRNHIKQYDFNTTVFSHPAVHQVQYFEKILIDAFS